MLHFYVYKQVIYDPALIGDKPKWYSRNLTSIPFNIIEENSTLGQAINSFKEKLMILNKHQQVLKIFNIYLFRIKFFLDESGSDSKKKMKIV